MKLLAVALIGGAIWLSLVGGVNIQIAIHGPPQRRGNADEKAKALVFCAIVCAVAGIYLLW